MENLRSEEEFWRIISDKDKTVLAKKGENKLVQSGQFIPLADQGLFPAPETQLLFASRSVGYNYKQAERTFLIELARQHLIEHSH